MKLIPGDNDRRKRLTAWALACACSIGGLAYIPFAAAQTQSPPAIRPTSSQRPQPVSPDSKEGRIHPGKKRESTRRRKEQAEKAPQPIEQPPSVTLKNGELTVDARNSDLRAILSDVAHISGMTIDGQQSSARVFGVYGPASPRKVLTELLEGAGYNFMMVGGSAGGAPRELLLIASAGPPAAPSKAAPEQPADDADDQDDQQPPGPGAIVHVPPSVAQQDDESQTQQRVQQQLQRLEAMHNAQQQQNQPQ